jgi:hypothetical protein
MPTTGTGYCHNVTGILTVNKIQQIRAQTGTVTTSGTSTVVPVVNTISLNSTDSSTSTGTAAVSKGLNRRVEGAPSSFLVAPINNTSMDMYQFTIIL